MGKVETRVAMLGDGEMGERRFFGVTIHEAAKQFAAGWFHRHPDRTGPIHLAARRGSASWSLTATKGEPVVVVEGLRGND